MTARRSPILLLFLGLCAAQGLLPVAAGQVSIPTVTSVPTLTVPTLTTTTSPTATATTTYPTPSTTSTTTTTRATTTTTLPTAPSVPTQEPDAPLEPTVPPPVGALTAGVRSSTPPETQPAAAPDDEAGSNGIPLPAVPLVLAALAGLAVLGRRK